MLDSPINNPPNGQSLAPRWLLARQSQFQLIRRVAQLIILAALVVHLALFTAKRACAQNEAERMLVAVSFSVSFSCSVLFSPFEQGGDFPLP